MKKPNVISTREVYKGWLELRVDTLKVPGLDKQYPYDVVTTGDGVGILPLLDGETVLLSRQYRHPVKSELLELIQGGMGDRETPEQAAHRELLEETGYKGEFDKQVEIHLMPGSLNQRMQLYLAHSLKKVKEPINDPLERMELVEVRWNDLLQDVLEGKHKDAALVASVLYTFATEGCH